MLAEMFTVLNLHFGRWVCCSSWLHGWLAVIVLSLLWRYQASGFPEDKIWTDVLPLLQLTGFKNAGGEFPLQVCRRPKPA